MGGDLVLMWKTAEDILEGWVCRRFQEWSTLFVSYMESVGTGAGSCRVNVFRLGERK